MTKPRQNSSIWSCVRRRRNGKCRRANGARRKPSSPSCSKTGSSWHDGQPAPHTRFLIVPDRKTALTAADLLNDRVVPFYDAQEVKLTRVLTDRGTEYCGNPEHHEYELYLAVEDVDHSRTKAKNPQEPCIEVGPTNHP